MKDITTLSQRLKTRLQNGNGHPEERAIAEAPAPSQDIALCPDGLPWDSKRIGERVCRTYGRILSDLVEIGQCLLVAKMHLAREDYAAWLEQYFPESREAAVRYMLLARRVYGAKDQQEVIRFLDTAAGNSKTKIYELLQVSDEEIQEAMQSDEFLGKPIDEVGSMSYRQIREELKRKDEAVKHLTVRRRELESEVADLRQAKYSGEPDELSRLITRVVLAMGELAVHLEGLPMSEILPKQTLITGPIQAQYDQIVDRLNLGFAHGDEREGRDA